jgi:hypothetical protein
LVLTHFCARVDLALIRHRVKPQAEHVGRDSFFDSNAKGQSGVGA